MFTVKLSNIPEGRTVSWATGAGTGTNAAAFLDAAPELTVSSPSATEGSDLNFTVTLSGTSGLVSLDVRPVSASASNPGRDYEPPSVSSLSRNIAGASGGRFTFSVKTIRDTVEEGPETLELHASVTAAGGLSAYGTGTILDRAAPPSGTASSPSGSPALFAGSDRNNLRISEPPIQPCPFLYPPTL